MYVYRYKLINNKKWVGPRSKENQCGTPVFRREYMYTYNIGIGKYNILYI